MLLLVSLLCLLAALPGATCGQVRCWPQETCGEIQVEDMPDCRASWVTVPDRCPYKDNYLSGTGDIPEKPPQCTVSRDNCSVEVTEGNLNVTLHPLSQHEATITVSWGHLRNLIPLGSQLELRLINSDPCSPGFGGYLFRTFYNFCTNSSVASSHTFPAVGYVEVNQVLLVVVSGSVATGIFRTRFASSTADFNCRNTDIIPFNIEFCQPGRYGQVENLTAEMTGEENMAAISWFPPAQHALYNDGLRYYLNITAHSPDSATQQHLFLISTNANDVSVGPLNSTLNYTVGVRAFGDCSGCGQNTITSIHNFPTTTPSAPAMPTITPTETTPTETTPTTADPPSVTADPLTIPLSVTLGVAGGTMLLLVIALLVALMYFATRQSRSVVSATSPVEDPDSSYKPEGSGTPPLQSPEDRPYIQLVSDSPYNHSGSSHTVSDQPVQLVDFSSELQWDDPENTSQILSGPMGGERESSNDREEILGCRRLYTVLIVYKPCTGPIESPEKLQSLILADKLNRFGAQDIRPTCIDMVSVRQQPLRYLESTAPTVDAVLCVWTKEFREDWDNHAPFAQVLRRAIEVKEIKDRDISNFASLLLEEDDVDYIPDTLRMNPHFRIDDLQKIAAFVQDVPIPVHIRRRRHSGTSSGSSRVLSRDRPVRPVTVEVTLDTVSPPTSPPRELDAAPQKLEEPQH